MRWGCGGKVVSPVPYWRSVVGIVVVAIVVYLVLGSLVLGRLMLPLGY